MYISHLSLTNFRNYGRLELSLPNGIILLHGDNAQGKTNLLEAIYYLATTRSPHADYDSQIINWDATQVDAPVTVGRLVATVQRAAGPQHIEMRLIQESNGRKKSFRREALIDRRKVRLMDLLGHLRVVLFLPDDVNLISGSPSERRRYMDITLCQTDAVYCRSLSAYNRVLEQRNAALKQLAETDRSRDVVSVLTEKLIQHGSRVLMRRAQFMDRLSLETQRIHYEYLTAGRETIRLSYLPRLTSYGLSRGDDDGAEEFISAADWLAAQSDPTIVQKRFAKTVQSNLHRDIASGVTNIGPHRDDWRFWVNGRSLSSYGSRGQQRTAMLALKMAEINRMTDETGEMPILLLDEVVAELDEQRRALLLAYVTNGAQAILTATDPSMFTADFLEIAASIRIVSGQVHQDKNVYP